MLTTFGEDEYVTHLFPHMRPGIPVCVHDVVLRWLAQRENTYFTASPARAPETYDQFRSLKRSVALGCPLSESTDNPMLFFTLR